VRAARLPSRLCTLERGGHRNREAPAPERWWAMALSGAPERDGPRDLGRPPIPADRPVPVLRGVVPWSPAILVDLVELVPSCASSSHPIGPRRYAPVGRRDHKCDAASTPLTRERATRSTVRSGPNQKIHPIHKQGSRRRGYTRRGIQTGDRVDHYPAAACLSRGSTPPPKLDLSKGAAKGR
jgi:hypothetical protein